MPLPRLLPRELFCLRRERSEQRKSVFGMTFGECSDGHNAAPTYFVCRYSWLRVLAGEVEDRAGEPTRRSHPFYGVVVVKDNHHGRISNLTS